MLGIQDLVERGPSAADVRLLDSHAREAFSQVPGQGAGSEGPVRSGDLYPVLDQSTRVLEQWRGVAAIAEAVHLSGVRTHGEVVANLEAIIDRARLLARIDPFAAFLSDPLFMEALKEGSRKPHPDDAFPLDVNAEFVRRVSSLVEFCPIWELTTASREIGLPELGHRCRLSYDWLRAFVRRHSPGERETLHVLGRAYAEGRLSLSETAHLLGMPRADAVAWLEEHSYARDLRLITRTPEQRARGFASMRRERLARQGKPRGTAELVGRDVIASQRIEGVDARPWLQTGE